MGLGGVPASERVHIGFFGKRNAGKSSLINAVTGQNLSIVSDTLGTTTDPVSKTMELLPLGPVVIIDTPGIDDVGELGAMRVQKAYEALNKCHIAVVVIDAEKGISEEDNQLVLRIKDKGIPYIICYNKCDTVAVHTTDREVCVSALTGDGVTELKEKIASLRNLKNEKYIIADRLDKGDVVVLVMPVDSGAPKGRIILPQQQTLREVLDAGGVCICVQPEELPGALDILGVKPAVVITDSQVFDKVSQMVPEDVYLTSFSILMLNYKGNLFSAVENAAVISELKDGDRVLIAEGCTHHRQCEDIGTVKIPALIRKTSGADIVFDFTSGGDFPEDLSPYSLVIQCGGCMLNENEIRYRTNKGKEQKVPVTNYGIALAYMNGILERSVEFFVKGDLK